MYFSPTNEIIIEYHYEKAQNNDWHITIVSSFRCFGARGEGEMYLLSVIDQTKQLSRLCLEA